MAKKIDMPSDQKANLILDAVEDRKAVDPVLLDLRGKTLITDFFLVCTGTSNVHIRSIAERVLERTEGERLPNPKVAGLEVGEWVLLDFGDVVLHVMNEEARDRYKLEQFWTTPQPKGALPPTPETAGAAGAEPGVDEADADFDEDEIDEDDEDAAFFDEADQEVEPVEEDDEDFGDEGAEENGPTSARKENGAR